MKRAILLLAWGAGSMQARAGLGMFEARCRQRFPGWPVRWAYTSELSRSRLSSEKRKSDSVHKALFRLYYEKCAQVAIQPLQIIPGSENDSVSQAVNAVSASTGMACSLGAPLLGNWQNMDNVAAALMRHLPAERQPGEDVILMGHGGKSWGTDWYGHLARVMAARDEHVFIGTMGGRHDLQNLLPRLTSERVWLLPLLATIGKHASHDMAGDGEGTWKGLIERSGHTCTPVLKSLSESLPLIDLWLDNLASAMARLLPPQA